MKEIWKPIKQMKGKYLISNLGQVKNAKNDNIVKPFINNSGYYEVVFSVGNKRLHFRVHRLVADAFLPNPYNLPIINHKDRNRLNNKLDNLQWCSYKYNNNYNVARRARNGYTTRIEQYDLNMNYIRTYNRMKDVENKFNVSRTAIRFCCLGKNKTCRGYIWRYADN